MSSNVMLRNHVKIFGESKQVIMMAHGFGCDQNVWRYLTPFFNDDYQVILFDYVGAGKSDLSAYTPHRYSSLLGYARDVLEICEALSLQNILFLGHSVSSMIGLLASIAHPELFERLILLCPSPRYLNDAPDYKGGFEYNDLEDLLSMMERNDLGWARLLAASLMLNSTKTHVRAELESNFCATEPSIARRFAEATFFADNRADLPLVTVPSLILQSRNDIIAPPEVGAYMHRNLPRSSFRILEVTGHCPHLSHPEEVAQAIRIYLSTSSKY